MQHTYTHMHIHANSRERGVCGGLHADDASAVPQLQVQERGPPALEGLDIPCFEHIHRRLVW